MKKIFFILIYIMLEIISYSETVVIAINSAPPYRIIEGKNISGIYVEIIKEVLKNSEIDIKFKEMPLKRGIESMKSGDVDLMLGPNKTEERSEYIFFIEKYPLPRESKAFYYLNDKNIIKQYEDLYNKRIDILRGAVYFKKIDEDNMLMKSEVNDYNNSLLKVNGGRSEIAIIPELQGDYLLKKNRLELKKSPFKIEGNLSFIAVSKKSKIRNKIIEKIEKELESIMNSKKYEDIMKKYGKE